MPQKSNDFHKGRENEHYTLVQMTSYDVRHSSSSCLFANEMKVHLVKKYTFRTYNKMKSC